MNGCRQAVRSAAHDRDRQADWRPSVLSPSGRPRTLRGRRCGRSCPPPCRRLCRSRSGWDSPLWESHRLCPGTADRGHSRGGYAPRHPADFAPDRSQCHRRSVCRRWWRWSCPWSRYPWTPGSCKRGHTAPLGTTTPHRPPGPCGRRTASSGTGSAIGGCPHQ